ncbi:unnamed protein product [Brassicogethes aeneus]|uniref:Mitotic spindle assembly checkpoint protein MAD1 n=1 Tax=Brassicogethes aeneus TaxID=1431903 RepID=A0A9P0FEZ2_BRAAE|nr:unnamed protein product [Brassicogethes aeneus]
MSNNGDETILNMVKNFKRFNRVPLFATPLKRQHSETSESSFEEGTPMKRIKESSKLDLSFPGSPREIRRINADLMEARNTIVKLESLLGTANNIKKQMQLHFDEQNHELKYQVEYNRKTIEQLETRLKETKKKEIEARNELAEVKSKLGILKIRSDERVEFLEKDLFNIQEGNKHNDNLESAEIGSLKRRINELTVLAESAEAEAEAQKKLVADLDKRITEKVNLEKDLELKEQAFQKAKLRIKELEYAKDNFLEFQEQAKTQSHKLANYIEMEKENEKLREENTRLKDEVRNKLVMEEEVFDLKNRLAKFKENEKKLQEIQTQQVQNEMALNEWRGVARNICETTDYDSALPHLLRTAVEKMQHQELNLTAEKVEIECKLKAAIHEARVAKAELEKNQKHLVNLKSAGEQKQTIIHRMQKKLLLVSRERDSYRLQLDSYERDLTMNATTTSLGSAAASQLQSQKDRIEKLERHLEGYRELNSKLESDLEAAQGLSHSEMIPVKYDQISKLEEEISQLKMENERMREKKDSLEIQLESYLEGNDTLAGGQVYHNANNPFAQSVAQRENLVEKLEQEVERLKRKCKNLEEGLEASKLGDLSVCPQEVFALKEQIKSHESQMQKLKDYFKTSMQEFRDVIYILLGYKIDRNGSSLYKLRSAYAEREEHMICFEINNKNGDLNLLENEYSATLEDMINLHLRHQKSFPVFLSALTMNLFNEKTRTFQG